MIDVPKSDLQKAGRLGWQAEFDVSGWSVDLRCPNGHIGRLGVHEITTNGRVSPSVICPHEGCGWDENIRLVGWKP